MNLLINAFKHFKTICIHKYWVAKYCFKVGLYWQGIIHDLSKFSPTEFWESIHYYTGTGSPINECKKDKGYSMAWFHHRGRNYHHYEMWVDNLDHGGVALEMPYKYATEMICDYLGAARAYLGKEFSYKKELDWWENKKKEAKINDSTKEYVSIVFRMLTVLPEKEVLNKSVLKELYYGKLG